MSTIAQALAHAYNGAPADWINSYPRITNMLRGRIREVATEGLSMLPTQRPGDDSYNAEVYAAEQALLGLMRTGSGTDPRGGPERAQMIHAANTVARELARQVIRDQIAAAR